MRLTTLALPITRPAILRRPLAAGIGLLLLFAAPSAFGQEITFFESAFLPTFVEVTTGDEVTFTWDDDPDNGEHNISIESAGGTVIAELTLDADNQQETVLFTTPGSFSVTDTASPLTGTISVEPFEVEVEVIDSAFEPQDVYLFEGDQVFWFYSDMLLHTVTNGVDFSDPELGVLFDVTFPAGVVDNFSYVFEEPGVVPYFCVPHLLIGMVGTVTVQHLFIRGDANDDQSVNIVDAIVILEYLFLGGDEPTCLDAYDADDDGSVALTDATTLLDALFNPTGEPLPQPYPVAGPDRTSDDGDLDPGNDNLCL